MRRQDAGATGQDARFRGARGGRPPNLFGGVPLRLAMATNRAERAVFSFGRRCASQGAGRSVSRRTPRQRGECIAFGRKVAAFTHRPGFFSPARRRRPRQRRRAGRGQRAEGAPATAARVSRRNPALSREGRAGGPGKPGKKRVPRETAPSPVREQRPFQAGPPGAPEPATEPCDPRAGPRWTVE